MSILELKHLDIFEANTQPTRRPSQKLTELLEHIDYTHMRAETAEKNINLQLVNMKILKDIQINRQDLDKHLNSIPDLNKGIQVSRSNTISLNGEGDFKVISSTIDNKPQKINHRVQVSKTPEHTPNTSDSIFGSLLLNMLLPGSGLIEHVRHGIDTIQEVSENTGRRLNLVFTNDIKPQNQVEIQKPLWKLRDEIESDLKKKKKEKKKNTGLRGF